MTIAESLALGVPVIAGDIGNIPYIIKHESSGLLFKYNDKKDLTAKINEMLKDSVRERLSKGAKAEYISKYSAKINYSILIDIYDKAKVK